MFGLLWLLGIKTRPDRKNVIYPFLHVPYTQPLQKMSHKRCHVYKYIINTSEKDHLRPLCPYPGQSPGTPYHWEGVRMPPFIACRQLSAARQITGQHGKAFAWQPVRDDTAAWLHSAALHNVHHSGRCARAHLPGCLLASASAHICLPFLAEEWIWVLFTNGPIFTA